MPRASRSAKLDTRTARARLAARSAPYFVKLHQGLQLGYAKGAKGGSWIARRYIGGKRYEKEKIGIADDLVDADAVKILDFWQAQAVAKSWAERERLADRGMARRGPYTVADAISDYIEHLTSTKGAIALRDARSNSAAHVLNKLGELLVADLTAERITRWRNEMGASPKLVRTKSSATSRAVRSVPDDPESRRKRRARANRVLTTLKAALNHAFHMGKAQSDEAWRRVKPFAGVDAPVIRYLSGDEMRRLANGCEPDFRLLVQGALLTGCRYGELIKLRAGDFNPDMGTVTIRKSKAGKARHVVLTDEGVRLFSSLVAGKASSDPIFKRHDGLGWAASHQQRPLVEASRRANISPAVSFHILRHTHASTLAMSGVPLGVIAAQLGHTDTRMTERHYAHLSSGYVADTIRASFPKLGIELGGNVSSIDRKGSRA